MNKEKKEKNAEISARVRLIIEKSGATNNSFALKLGYARSQTIYDIINEKSAPSYDFFYRFMISEYSEIYNIDWLLTGQGEMLKTKRIVGDTPSDEEPSTVSKDTSKNPEKQEISAIISQLLDTIKEQAEEIGQLKVLINDLERRIRAAEDT